MKSRASSLVVEAAVEHRAEADALLKGPGSAVVVRRGVLRSIVISCPDGCGEVLTINLDPRGGPAWRLYQKEGKFSLYPSVWRHTGCRSHFIVWRSVIFWCDYESLTDESDEAFDESVASALTGRFQPYGAIAERLNEIPWAVLMSCERLVKAGRAEREQSERRQAFRLKSSRTWLSFKR